MTLDCVREKFEIKSGEQQGNTILPKLFNAVLEGIFRRLE